MCSHYKNKTILSKLFWFNLKINKYRRDRISTASCLSILHRTCKVGENSTNEDSVNPCRKQKTVWRSWLGKSCLPYFNRHITNTGKSRRISRCIDDASESEVMDNVKENLSYANADLITNGVERQLEFTGLVQTLVGDVDQHVFRMEI